MLIPLASPDLDDRDRNSVWEVLSGSSLSLGPKLPEFEGAVAAYTQAKFAIAVNSGTSGMHLAVKASGVSENDEVITTPFSFVASANSILFERGTPRFVDIDPLTWNMDVDQVESAINGRTRAILPVHVFGRPCRMTPLIEIAARHGLEVIEDACEAMGARYQTRSVGTFGQSGVFAFYPNKQMTTGEGGVIVTDDAEVAKLCRSWRNQGRGEDNSWLQHERLGYNYRLSEINCALGISQLARLPSMLCLRAAAASRYSETLREIAPDIILPAPAEPDIEISWFVYVVRLPDEFSREDRDAVLQSLRALGIGCNNYFTPIHLQSFYRDLFGYKPGNFPVTEHISARTIALPFFNRISAAQIATVCEALADAVSRLKRRS